ncbi:MAG: hypothetical protein K0R46_2826, partial [Herbinix sp.]|nr:hypothetical protein [Herbinix sp.]
MRKLLSVVLVTTLVLSSMVGCGKKEAGNITIGIGQFAEHGSL